MDSNKLCYLLFILPVCLASTRLLAQSPLIEVKEEISFTYKTEPSSEELGSAITNLKVQAMESKLPVLLESEMQITERQENADFYRWATSETTSKVEGIWVRDINPPKVLYSKEGRKKWVTIIVHGYITKKRTTSEARTLLLNQLSLKPALEGVQIYSVEYYPNSFVVSAVVLKSSDYTSTSEMNRVASLLAKRQVLQFFQGSQIEDVFIYAIQPNGVTTASSSEDALTTFNAIKEHSSGWVNGLESLALTNAETDEEWRYIFIKELSDQ